MLYCVFNQINAALVSIRDFFQKHKKIFLPPIFWLHFVWWPFHLIFMYTCCVFRMCLYILYINVPNELFLSVVCRQWCHESRGDRVCWLFWSECVWLGVKSHTPSEWITVNHSCCLNMFTIPHTFHSWYVTHGLQSSDQ